jgi:hypothetical protein
LDTKSCLVCFQDIDVRARKCHHCREIQSRAAAMAYHPRVIAAFMIFVALLLVWLFYTLARGADRHTFVGKLAIGTPTMRQSTADDESRVSCVVSITNSDTIRWARLSLQAEFLDAQGRIIDVHNHQGGFSIFPGVSAAARVSGPRSAPSADYSSCRMTVLDARPGS